MDDDDDDCDEDDGCNDDDDDEKGFLTSNIHTHTTDMMTMTKKDFRRKSTGIHIEQTL